MSMTFLEDSLQKAVYALSENSVHPDVIDFVHDMHEGREYHNLDHAKHCFILFNAYYHDYTIKEEAYLTIAFYFHDIYQDLAKSMSAIRESAEMMDECLCDVLNAHDRKVIRDIILSTGVKMPTTKLEKIMHDVDYAVLGHEDWDAYYQYAKALEIEASKQGIDAKQFYEGRMNFLKMLACIPQIYLTEEIGKYFEWFARRNIIRENARRQKGDF